jgi:chaperonin GroES
MADSLGYATRQVVPVPEPQGHIDTSALEPMEQGDPSSLAILNAWASSGGDISDMLPDGELSRLGAQTIREWRLDQGSRKDWVERAEHYLDLAAQETDDDDREPIWENAADVHYPILSTATGQFLARASPELIKGDKVVGVKVFSPPSQQPSPVEAAKAGPQPQDEQQAQQAAMALQQAEQAQAKQAAMISARNARAERVKHFLNFLIFYRMDDWEEDSDLLLLQASAIGSGFKKVYMGERGLRSDFMSATCLTVHNDAKSLHTCPRITQEFEVYPNEIEERKRSGVYRNVTLDALGSEDPEAPRTFIEQHRLDDLDGDGLAEPYMVTVDVKTMQVMSVVPSYTPDDIILNKETGQVIRIDRWQPFAMFTFLPDPRGRFYGIGLGSLLDSITATIDTLLNQMIDANTAAIAGGGFIGSGVRLQGSGQGGSLFFGPGEFKTVNSPGIDLRQAIWERTVPNQSPNSMNLLELLLGAAKDISSIKDVITGEAPSTAPVGTTLALQNQALQVFSSIYKRIYRGFHDEFRLMYRCLKRWATDKEKFEYNELTGGDFDQDFQGDGTDIEPVADPTVVTKMQKIAKFQTVIQFAESPVGMAAGMTQSGPAQALATDFLDAIDYDRPERLIAQVQPNPELIAKTQETQAAAELKGAQAMKTKAEVGALVGDAHKTAAETTHIQAQTVKTIGETAHSTHLMHVIADQIHDSGSLQPPPEGESDGQTSPSTNSPA